MPKRQQIPTISLIHSIICDDIRREDNGKFILIGVYPEVIMLNTLPAQIVLSIWLQFRMQIFSKTALEFEIRGSAIPETMPFSLEMGDETIFGKSEAIPIIVKLPFNIKDEGGFIIYYRKKGDTTWQVAKSIEIKRNTTAPTQTMQ